MTSIDRRHGQTFKVFAFALACFVLLTALHVAAEDFTVSNTADDGTGSLRQGIEESIEEIEVGDTTNTILFEGFDDESESTFRLGAPLLDVSGILIVDGTGSGALDIEGDGTDVLRVAQDGQLQLNDISFSAGAISLGNAANLTFNVTGDTITISDDIDEFGTTSASILKTGSGTLILTGTNTFTGTTQINQGTLEVTTSAISLETRIALDAILRFSETPDQTYAGAISEAGRVEKNGTSTLTLTGTNNYSGGTTINGGALRGAPGSIQGDIEITLGTTLEIVDNDGSTFTGTIVGDGTLVKSGNGTLVLDPTSGSNSWLEAQVSNGTLQGDVAAISGNVDILPMGTLIIDQTGTATLSGNLRGAGKFEKRGDGNLTLTGNNTGLTNADADAILIMAGGGLIGNISSIPTNVMIQSGASLTFNQSVAGTYDNIIDGGGDFIKTGSGTLTLNGGRQTYTGSTTISAGRLNVLGLATSSTTVATGATLGGTGSINGDVMISGRIAPGTSIGTLQVGNITFLPGSVLEIEIDPTPSPDPLVFTGLAELANGALELSIAGGTYTNASFTIVRAAGMGMRDGIPSFTDDFPLLDIFLVESGTDLDLKVNSNGNAITDIATTPNQRAVGIALDAETPADGTDLKTVIETFSTLRTPEFAAALDSLSGETLTQFATVRFELADRFDIALHSRLRDASDTLDLSRRGRGRRRTRPKGLAGVGAASTRPSMPQVDLWFEPYVVFGGIDGHQGQSDVDYTLFGGILGVETHPFPSATNELRNLRLGAAYAYGRSELKFDDRDGSGSADSYMGALYGGWSNDRFRAGVSTRLAYSNMKSERSIVVGTIDRDARADFDGLDLGTRVEVGGKWISNKKLVLESYGALDYAHLQRSSIRERGATSVNLLIDREKLETLRGSLGTRLLDAARVSSAMASSVLGSRPSHQRKFRKCHDESGLQDSGSRSSAQFSQRRRRLDGSHTFRFRDCDQL
jgi:autotransporter-associated beta strand protein